MSRYLTKRKALGAEFYTYSCGCFKAVSCPSPPRRRWPAKEQFLARHHRAGGGLLRGRKRTDWTHLMFKNPRSLPRTPSVIYAHLIGHYLQHLTSLPKTHLVIAKNTLGYYREGGNLQTPPENPTNHTTSVIPIYAQRQILI